MTQMLKVFGLILLAIAFGAGSESTLSGTAAQNVTENPISITFVIHFDPLFAPGGRVDRQAYERERDNLAWLADFLDQLEREQGPDFVPKLTLEIAGDHAEYYSEDPVGLALLKRLYAKGHQLGMHFHSNYKAGPHNWPDARSQNTPEMRRRVTTDHIREVDALVAKIIGTTDPTAIRQANHAITGHFLDEALAQQMGFDLLTGGRNEALNLFFDHDVYNPWRPTMGPGAWPLAEDSTSPWVLIPQAPVLGAIGEHFPLPAGVPPEYTQGMRSMVWQDLSIPAMQRKFWHLYLEWLARQRSQDPVAQRVWGFGWHEHTNNLFADDGAYGNIRNLRDEVREFVNWLNENFVNKRTSDGKLIAKYATVEEVVSDFRLWEQAHTGQTSFNYPVRVRDWNVYPYQLKGLTRELMYTHYETEITAFRAQGVNVHKLLKTDGRNWVYQNGRVVSIKPTWDVYLLWSEAGEKMIDFSSVLSGTVKCASGRSGVEKVQSAASLLVTEEPIICVTAQSTGPMKLVQVNNAIARDAVCNDGTPAAYYFRRGQGTGSHRWVIHLQGGGMCYSVETCQHRSVSTPYLMTSTGLPSTRTGGGVLSPSSHDNPDFFNANHVYVHYCSSDLWSGDREATAESGGWHFRGRASSAPLLTIS